MEIRQLVTFKTIVEAGGFTKAAEQLGYAQSTVTAHIQALEQEIGMPVFDRVGKKVLLTEAGKHLLPHAAEMIQLYEKAKDISRLQDQPQGELRIGAPESLTVYRLPSIIQAFRRQYPKVKIIMKTASCWTLQEDLRRGDLDIAFALQASLTNTAVHTEQLLIEPFVIILPPEHPAGALGELQLSPQDHVLFTERGGYRDYFEAFLRQKGIRTDNGMEFWSIEAIKQCVICGLGVAMLPLMTVRNELEAGKLRGIPWDNALGSTSTLVSYHKQRWLSQAARVFLEMTREQAKGWT
ncbi:LysR family transcriptional regulator [Ectobacillus ponti]|uniref:LysR family transcriptional regulator n=1 Tax=Ectobacillus ponti TaxID=2961894 RepID=A0AA41X5N6_9BACI|nr:LysR family transcriptional regulator [Ectobacillus ponti]MCP8969389.1 LysR family transcriptional regulator [Ectobacillus ponti]